MSPDSRTIGRVSAVVLLGLVLGIPAAGAGPPSAPLIEDPAGDAVLADAGASVDPFDLRSAHAAWTSAVPGRGVPGEHVRFTLEVERLGSDLAPSAAAEASGATWVWNASLGGVDRAVVVTFRGPEPGARVVICTDGRPVDAPAGQVRHAAVLSDGADGSRSRGHVVADVGLRMLGNPPSGATLKDFRARSYAVEPGATEEDLCGLADPVDRAPNGGGGVSSALEQPRYHRPGVIPPDERFWRLPRREDPSGDVEPVGRIASALDLGALQAEFDQLDDELRVDLEIGAWDPAAKEAARQVGGGWMVDFDLDGTSWRLVFGYRPGSTPSALLCHGDATWRPEPAGYNVLDGNASVADGPGRLTFWLNRTRRIDHDRDAGTGRKALRLLLPLEADAVDWSARSVTFGGAPRCRVPPDRVVDALEAPGASLPLGRIPTPPTVGPRWAVQIQPPDETVRVAPGGRTATGLEVVNAGRAPQRVQLEIETPEEWSARVDPRDVPLPPEPSPAARREVSFEVQAPDDARPGQKAVLGVRGRGLGGASARVHVPVRVAATPSSPAELRPVRTSVETRPGQSVRAIVEVVNPTDRSLDARLDLRGEAAVWARLEVVPDTATLPLEPGEVREAYVHVRPPGDVGAGTRRLVVEGTTGSGEVARTELRVVVKPWADVPGAALPAPWTGAVVVALGFAARRFSGDRNL